MFRDKRPPIDWGKTKVLASSAGWQKALLDRPRWLRAADAFVFGPTLAWTPRLAATAEWRRRCRASSMR